MARLVARWKTKAPADWSAGLEPPTAYEETVREEAHFLPRGLTAVRNFDTSKGPIVDPPSLVYEPPPPLLRFASDISLAGRAPEWPPLFFALEGPPLLLARPNSSCAASSSSSSDAASLPVLVATAASGFAPSKEPEGWGGPCRPPSLEPSLSSTAVAASILEPFSADASPDSMQSLPRRVRPSSAKATKHGRSVRDVNEPVVYEDDSSANDSVNDADDVVEWVRYAGEGSRQHGESDDDPGRIALADAGAHAEGGDVSAGNSGGGCPSISRQCQRPGPWLQRKPAKGTSARPNSPAHNRQQRSAVAHRHEQPTSAAARAQLVELNARPPSKPPSRRGRRPVGLSGGVGDRPMGATLVAGPPASASAPLVARPSQPAAAAAAVLDSLRLPRARAGVLAAALDVAVALEASKPQVPHRSNGADVEHREVQEEGAELLEMLLQGELQRGGDRHRKVPLAGPHLPALVASFLAVASLPTLNRLGPALLALVVASLWPMAVSSRGAEVVVVMPSARSHGHLRRRGVQPAWFAPCR
eukprot:CAMPEP_0203844894 /NCGR_PEP_ID=MMETSP0359-20131031/3482_1 /ASSEMBLY_ACC=CAM_ASM_000338 /TAXON_ID=268821 /ORGANISM="Scrippsiella Hangoei, Strain SHTV-5" /LENGTH=530 /DNA_ID=CAMNT_0050759933 /DNA_START=38 /DNA_END=1631 /DNA_ORIENTATION=-